METKVCARCGLEKPISEFRARKDMPKKYRSWCVECGRNSANEWYYAHKEQALDAAKAWSEAHPVTRVEIRKKYRDEHKETLNAKERKRNMNNPEPNRQRNKAWKRKIREEMIAAYGGKCSCCGETRYEFLTLEHKNGGGYQDRRTSSGISILRRLRDQGWPKDGYTILCWNCNASKGVYGYCPHEKEREVS